MKNSLANALKPQSMTGYAVVEHVIENSRFRLHLKSVNNRFFDLKWRAPKSWLHLEIEFKNQLKQEFQRGSFEFWVEELKDADASSEVTAQSYMERLQRTVHSIKGVSKVSIPSFVQALILSRSPDLWIKNLEHVVEAEKLRPVFATLLKEFRFVREEEGAKLSEHLKSLHDRLKSSWLTIQERLPQLRHEFETEMRKRLETLFSQFKTSEQEHTKIASEIALQIDRRDCSEEMQRIEMHLNAFDRALTTGESNLGKRLDFIAQELNREWNTLGSKVRIQEIFQLVLESKLEIEKIREQCLNLA